MLSDLKLAWRTLLRSPYFTAIAVLTLALGIGVNTAIFSVLDAVLLRPVAAPALDRLVVVKKDLIGLDLLGADSSIPLLSLPEIVDLQARKDLFQSAGGYTQRSAPLTGSGEARQVEVALTIGEFFGAFAVRPAVGRLYGPEDSREGAPRVAVLSHGAWQLLAGGDPAFIGRSITLNGGPLEVIGVLPPQFDYPRWAQVFVPVVLGQGALDPSQRNRLGYAFVGRMAPAMTLEQLDAGLTAELRGWQQRFGEYDRFKAALYALPFVEFLAGRLRPILLALTGAVVVVLLIACANIASLQLVRAGARYKEIAIRFALGSGRGAVMRLLLVESVLVAAAGGALGVAVGSALLHVAIQATSAQYPMLADAQLNADVLLFTAAVAIVTGLVAGLLPAWHASRVLPREAMQEATRGTSLGSSRQRVLRASVVVQTALTLMLLIAAALTLQSFVRLLQTDPGFRPEQTMSMQVSLPWQQYKDHAARLAFYETLLEKLGHAPGVEAASVGSFVPFGTGLDSSPLQMPGQPPAAGEPDRHADINVVMGDYFRTLSIRLIRGRSFAVSDNNPDAPSVIVNDELVRRYFGEQDPLGKQVLQLDQPATIVGVVGSASRNDLAEPHKPTVYYHFAEYPFLNTPMYVTLRSTLQPATLLSLVRDVVREQDANVPVYDAMPMMQRLDNSLGPRRLASFALSAFAALALLLAIIGLYGVMSYGVTQRRQEIAVRMALGAATETVLRMVLRQGMLVVAIGIAAGLAGAFVLARVLAAFFYEVSAVRPTTLVAVSSALAVVALLACYLPARRAARIDPAVALRLD